MVVGQGHSVSRCRLEEGVLMLLLLVVGKMKATLQKERMNGHKTKQLPTVGVRGERKGRRNM